MTTMLKHALTGYWLTGPIFDKELRVSSRRRRNYLIRMAYVTLLAIFLSSVWASLFSRQSNSVYTISRMANAGRDLTLIIVWFQFIACQILAIVMLSTAISEEVYHRTLGVLMTTPINSLQIVFGKLLSKLWQLVLLLAISLPLLAMFRVFGGIPWPFIAHALVITLASAIFVASLSLFYSIFLRRSYVVIIVTILTLAVLYFFLPLFCLLLGSLGRSFGQLLERVLFYTNPFVTLGTLQTEALFSGRTPWLGTHSWLIPCVIQMGSAALLLLLSVARVRHSARRQIAGEATPTKRREPASAGAVRHRLSRPLRSVQGCPIRWKEFRLPLLGRRPGVPIAVGLLILIPLLILYANLGVHHALDDDEVHIGFVLTYMGLGMLVTLVIPATCVTAEKESGAWPVLLGTTIGDRSILMGKLWGALRRCLWAWVPLAVHVLVFTLTGTIHPGAALGMLLVLTGAFVFHACAGLYFSARCRRTTGAVVLNIGLPAVLWLLLPLLVQIVASLTFSHAYFLAAYIDLCPIVQTVVVLEGGISHRPNLLRYSGPYMRLDGPEVLFYLLASASLFVVLGILFAWRAKCRFRRNVFR